MRGLLLIMAVVAVIYCVMNPDHLNLIAGWAMTAFHR